MEALLARQLVEGHGHMVFDVERRDDGAEVVERLHAAAVEHLPVRARHVQEQDVAEGGGAELLREDVAVDVAERHDELDAAAVHHLQDTLALVVRERAQDGGAGAQRSDVAAPRLEDDLAQYVEHADLRAQQAEPRAAVHAEFVQRARQEEHDLRVRLVRHVREHLHAPLHHELGAGRARRGHVVEAADADILHLLVHVDGGVARVAGRRQADEHLDGALLDELEVQLRQVRAVAEAADDALVAADDAAAVLAAALALGVVHGDERLDDALDDAVDALDAGEVEEHLDGERAHVLVPRRREHLEDHDDGAVVHDAVLQPPVLGEVGDRPERVEHRRGARPGANHAGERRDGALLDHGVPEVGEAAEAVHGARAVLLHARGRRGGERHESADALLLDEHLGVLGLLRPVADRHRESVGDAHVARVARVVVRPRRDAVVVVLLLLAALGV
mmetsp:Transcript_3223/g.9322  ORF Transcript_3223/g.9322 Transcript_3223/m.9322 type:complete len:448 (-) Transcript_3223:946-2289(-)